MKKILSFLLAMVMILSAIPTLASATEPNEQFDGFDISLGEIRDVFHDYLEDSANSLTPDTAEYYTYIVDQLLDKSDVALLNHPNYDLIHSYMVEYKLAYEDYLLCNENLVQNNYNVDIVTAISDTSSCVTYDKNTNEVSFNLTTEFLNQTLAEIAQANQQQSRAAVAMPAVTYSYSGSDAAAYARRYANDYNSTYPSYSADCTNFVSQCVYAGGIPMDGSNTSVGTYETTSDWYCIYINSILWVRRYAVTTSWIRVSDFSTFMSNIATKSTHTTIRSLYNSSAVGDVVQLADKNTGSAYHSIIISAKDSTSAYYCGHSNERKDVNIADALDESSDKFILFHFS